MIDWAHSRIVLLMIGVVGSVPLICAQELKIMSLNIRYDNPADAENAWVHRKEGLAPWIKDSITPDVICLQEVLHHQLVYLESQWRTDYDYYGVGREDGVMKGEYSPIFYKKSRFEVVKGETYWLSPTPDLPSKGWDAACERIVTVVYLKDKKLQDTLCVFNTHWDHVGSIARLKSADILLQLYSLIPHHYSFFCGGDFNATAEEECIAQLASQWLDLTPSDDRSKPTFSGFQENPIDAKRIDFLWTRKGDFRQRYFHQVRGIKGIPFLSDHDAIWIDMR